MTQHMIQIDSDTLNDMQGTITELKMALDSIVHKVDSTTLDPADQHHALGFIRHIAQAALKQADRDA